MSASQLLRILQTLPAGANNDLCAFNMDEVEESMNKCTNPFLSNEDDDPVNFWSNPELETSVFGNEINITDEDMAFSNSCNVPSHLFGKTTGFYVDKHLVECELPDIVVCYKERDFNVKDVCVDEGVPNESTISIDKDNKESYVPLNRDHDKMIEDTLDNELLNHEWLSPSTMTDSYSDVQSLANVYGPSDLMNTYEKELNSSNDLQEDVSAEELASNSMFPLQPDWSPTPLKFIESSNSYAHVVNQQPRLKNSEQEFPERAVVSKKAKPCKTAQMKYTVNESEIEGSVTFHFDTGKTATSSGPSGFNNQDVSSGEVANNQMRHVEGDSSFSMAGVISELMSCSRPMPFSGGIISNRSDSNATSTRSFAFPTLETEYVSSPVRMGKADRRRLQKHNGWRHGLLCCKF